eukprot:6967268-Prymnesium_polylepis.1
MCAAGPTATPISNARSRRHQQCVHETIAAANESPQHAHALSDVLGRRSMARSQAWRACTHGAHAGVGGAGREVRLLTGYPAGPCARRRRRSPSRACGAAGAARRTAGRPPTPPARTRAHCGRALRGYVRAREGT